MITIAIFAIIIIAVVVAVENKDLITEKRHNKRKSKRYESKIYSAKIKIYKYVRLCECVYDNLFIRN
jgi:NADH:ubiquinone oxidoreductase subunit 3 (subunit A)